MALKTFGTNATTSLSGFIVGTNDVIAADVATMITQFRGDPPGYSSDGNVGSTGLVTGQGSNRPRINEAYMRQGILLIPNRGRLQLKRGDFVCWDVTTGWPIVISGDAAANGPYTHT
jgi:hypothetical protein